MPNVFEPEWDAEQSGDPYRWRRARVGAQAGSRGLGASVFELSPGAATFPLHAHLHNEELLVVLAGTPSLETLDGHRRLAEGEVVAFPPGRAGAHRVRNESEAPARLLIVSTMLAPEVNDFPETGELWVRDYVPGTRPPPGAVDVRVRREPGG